MNQTSADPINAMGKQKVEPSLAHLPHHLVEAWPRATGPALNVSENLVMPPTTIRVFDQIDLLDLGTLIAFAYPSVDRRYGRISQNRGV
jgi:hypothetical protein